MEWSFMATKKAIPAERGMAVTYFIGADSAFILFQ